MRTVRNTVNTGRTVVCTIHQPSIDIFEVRERWIVRQLLRTAIHIINCGTNFASTHNTCVVRQVCNVVVFIAGLRRPAAHEGRRHDHVPWTSRKKIAQSCGVFRSTQPLPFWKSIWMAPPSRMSSESGFVVFRSERMLTRFWDSGEFHVGGCILSSFASVCRGQLQGACLFAKQLRAPLQCDTKS